MTDEATRTLKPGWTDRTVAAGREIIVGQRRGIRALLPFAGPAIVASIAYMDPGNFATNIEAGSRYGYLLLWVVVLANVTAMFTRCGAPAKSPPWRPISPSFSELPSA
jgi:manganese transport protein